MLRQRGCTRVSGHQHARAHSLNEPAKSRAAGKGWALVKQGRTEPGRRVFETLLAALVQPSAAQPAPGASEVRRAQRRLRRPGGALRGPEWWRSRGCSPPGDDQEEDSGLRLTLLAYNRDPQHVPGAGLLPGRSQPSPPPSYLLRPPGMAGFPVPATLPSPGSPAAVASKQTTQNSPHGWCHGKPRSPRTPAHVWSQARMPFPLERFPHPGTV